MATARGSSPPTLDNMTASGSDDQKRVGNPERERAVEFLNSALTQGYLDIGEFDERTAAVYAARTRGELAHVLVHLPGEDRLFPGSASPAGDSPPTGGPAATELDISWKTVTRRGSWRVPDRLIVSGSMGTANLDFSDARFTHHDVDLEIQVSASSVKVLLAGDQSIALDDLVCSSWSSIKDRAGPSTIMTGPAVRVRGALSNGSTIVIRRS